MKKDAGENAARQSPPIFPPGEQASPKSKNFEMIYFPNLFVRTQTKLIKVPPFNILIPGGYAA